MSQRFYKGRTNNHLTWVMVDATDFATPESALSAAMTIKIHGKLRGQAAPNFVSSGTGSLTNDIVHVGASATGIYTIALAKADLSDASAAWYDQYIITLAGTGAAQQVLVVDGGIDNSAISAYQSRLSDLASYLVAMSGMLSDAHSAAILAASNASEAQSNALLIQSRLSDFQSVYASDMSDVRSMLTALSDAVSDAHSDLGSKIGAITASVSASDISDIASAVWAHTVGTRVDSRVLVIQSIVSDIESDVRSDIKSAIAGITASVSASDISDIASAVWAHTVGTRVDSRVLVVQSLASDAHSAAVVAQALSASDLSDLRSAIAAGPAATVTASDISDIASAVRAILVSDLSDILSAAVQTNSRVILVQSRLSDFNSVYTSDISDLRSYLSDIHSDLKSAIGGVTATVSASDMSDIASRVDVLLASRLSDILSAATQINSRVLVVQSMASDTYSLASNINSATLVAADVSDFASAVWAEKYTANSAASSFGSLFSDIYSRLLLNQSRISDVQSALAAGVELGASSLSDIRSAIAAGPAATVTASDISDIASAVRAILVSDLSDILSAAVQTNSRVILVQSRLSDFNSVYTSDISDIKSQLTIIQSMASDAHSAATAGGNVSLISDIYSLLSDLHSDVTVMSGVLSDTYSAVQATELDASDLSDIASAVWARAGADPATVPAVGAAMGAKLDWLTALSRNKITQNSAVQSLRNDADSADIASAAVSDDGTTFTRGEFA